jgi:pimeloyl-ACP methyl ester carboxylesterase
MVALELAARHARAIGGLVLVDGGISRMRDAFPSWHDAKAALAPPHLAGTPEAEFRAMIPMFFGDAVTVCREVLVGRANEDPQGASPSPYPRLLHVERTTNSN